MVAPVLTGKSYYKERPIIKANIGSNWLAEAKGGLIKKPLDLVD